MKLTRFLSLLLVGGLLLTGCAAQSAPEMATPETATPETATPETATPATATPESAEPDPLQAVLATCADNATGEKPQVTDPAGWNEAGRDIIDGLAADPVYAGRGFTGAVREGCPYLLAVNRAASTVTVYTADEENRYTVPFMAMVCSGGSDTPVGFFHTPIKYEWRLLSGPCYGQYATRIWDAYLFHSVPYYTQHKDDVEYDQFNQLGTHASLGCIRLAVVDVKWIYDNCPLGTPVIIYDDPERPGPMGKPGTIYTDPADESRRGWDPTDPDPVNPWPDNFRTGTAIRSQAAWDQWDELHEEWNTRLTPTDLRGFSTDSSKEGTRG